MLTNDKMDTGSTDCADAVGKYYFCNKKKINESEYDTICSAQYYLF